MGRNPLPSSASPRSLRAVRGPGVPGLAAGAARLGSPVSADRPCGLAGSPGGGSPTEVSSPSLQLTAELSGDAPLVLRARPTEVVHARGALGCASSRPPRLAGVRSRAEARVRRPPRLGAFERPGGLGCRASAPKRSGWYVVASRSVCDLGKLQVSRVTGRSPCPGAQRLPSSRATWEPRGPRFFTEVKRQGRPASWSVNDLDRGSASGYEPKLVSVGLVPVEPSGDLPAAPHRFRAVETTPKARHRRRRSATEAARAPRANLPESRSFRGAVVVSSWVTRREQSPGLGLRSGWSCSLLQGQCRRRGRSNALAFDCPGAPVRVPPTEVGAALGDWSLVFAPAVPGRSLARSGRK